ncbi:MAG: VOC family protein [Myxococcales bacterium]
MDEKPEAALHLVTLVVDEYDPAVRFFVDVLGFDLVEDSPSTTNDGRVKRWVVVRPPGATTGLLLARADGPAQSAVVGNQTAGRVGFFLRVGDFEGTLRRLEAAGVEITSPPRNEPYGRVAVFRDLAGNKWDSARAAPRGLTRGAGADWSPEPDSTPPRSWRRSSPIAERVVRGSLRNLCSRLWSEAREGCVCVANAARLRNRA